MASSRLPIHYPHDVGVLFLERLRGEWLNGVLLGLSENTRVGWQSRRAGRLCAERYEYGSGWVRLTGTLELLGEGHGMLLVDGSGSRGGIVGAGAVFVLLSWDGAYFLPFGGEVACPSLGRGLPHSGLIEVMALSHILWLIPATFDRWNELRELRSLTVVTDRMATFFALENILASGHEPAFSPFYGFLSQVMESLYWILQGGVFGSPLEFVKVLHRRLVGVHVSQSHAWYPVNVDGVSRGVLGVQDLRGLHVSPLPPRRFHSFVPHLNCRRGFHYSGACLVFSLRKTS